MRVDRPSLALLGVVALSLSLFGLSPTDRALAASDPDGGEPKDPACRVAMDAYDDGDFGAALEWYKKSAAADNPCGINGLGNYYYEGLAVAKDYPRAIAYYRRAAAMGYLGAENNLGEAYLHGNGVPKDEERGLALLQSAAERGYALADNVVGIHYMYGKQPGDFEKAEHYFLIGYEHGEMRCAVNLGHLYYHHESPGHLEKAFHWFSLSSMYDQSAKMLGEMYWQGQGVKADLPTARGWFQQAAESSESDGEYYYGYMLYHGLGGPQDQTQGLRWLKAAADRGNASAMDELAKAALMTHPPISPERMQFAAAYFLSSAKLGDTDAQANIASILIRGIGFYDDPSNPAKEHFIIAPDPEQAYVWYKVAMTKKNMPPAFYSQAARETAALEPQFTPAQLADAHEHIARQLRWEAAADCGC